MRQGGGDTNSDGNSRERRNTAAAGVTYAAAGVREAGNSPAVEAATVALTSWACVPAHPPPSIHAILLVISLRMHPRFRSSAENAPKRRPTGRCYRIEGTKAAGASVAPADTAAGPSTPHAPRRCRRGPRTRTGPAPWSCLRPQCARHARRRPGARPRTRPREVDDRAARHNRAPWDTRRRISNSLFRRKRLPRALKVMPGPKSTQVFSPRPGR